MHSERGQEIHTNYFNSFLKKTSPLKQRVILGLKMVCPHNLGHFGPKKGTSSELQIHSRIFFAILHNARGQQVHKNYISGFCEKILIWGKWTIVGLKIVCLDNSGSTVRIFFEILLNERGQEIHGAYINGFCEKILIWGKWSILA